MLILCHNKLLGSYWGLLYGRNRINLQTCNANFKQILNISLSYYHHENMGTTTSNINHGCTICINHSLSLPYSNFTNRFS